MRVTSNASRKAYLIALYIRTLLWSASDASTSTSYSVRRMVGSPFGLSWVSHGDLHTNMENARNMMKIKLIKRMRGKKISLWADLPAGIVPGNTQWNIWDITPKEATPDVLSAIKHAFALGMHAQRKAYEEVTVRAPTDFEEGPPWSGL
jgi:hypothetical protein